MTFFLSLTFSPDYFNYYISVLTVKPRFIYLLETAFTCCSFRCVGRSWANAGNSLPEGNPAWASCGAHSASLCSLRGLCGGMTVLLGADLVLLCPLHFLPFASRIGAVLLGRSASPGVCFGLTPPDPPVCAPPSMLSSTSATGNSAHTRAPLPPHCLLPCVPASRLPACQQPSPELSAVRSTGLRSTWLPVPTMSGSLWAVSLSGMARYAFPCQKLRCPSGLCPPPPCLCLATAQEIL